MTEPDDETDEPDERTDKQRTRDDERDKKRERRREREREYDNAGIDNPYMWFARALCTILFALTICTVIIIVALDPSQKQSVLTVLGIGVALVTALLGVELDSWLRR